MHDLVRVRLVKDVAKLFQDPGCPVERHRDARLEQLVEALALDELHLDEGGVLGHPRVIDGNDVGVRESGHHPRLALEPRLRLGVEGDPRDDQLQRPQDVELDVPDQPDGPHPPLAELLLDEVAVEEDSARFDLAHEVVFGALRRGFLPGRVIPTQMFFWWAA